ncbi:hypothetical protein [Nitrosomonas sp.]|uniref:hypothetical protein n=1 Tax=Nitrosomonas sp. TaxID=42353 RepID=UPI00374D6F29
MADQEQRQNKSNEKIESQKPADYPSTESPHGISERSNAKEGDQSSSVPSSSSNKNATSDEKEKNKFSSDNHPKH